MSMFAHPLHAELWGGPRDGELLHVAPESNGEPADRIEFQMAPNLSVYDSAGDDPIQIMKGIYQRDGRVKRGNGHVWLYRWKGAE